MIKFVALTTLLAGSVVSLGLAASSPAGATTPSCSPTQLRPHYEGFQGTAGTFHDIWQLINVGATCQVKGHMSLRNYGSDGRPLASATTFTGTAATVILATNQHASWSFSYTDPGVLNCTPEAATNMTVFVPGASVSEPLLAGRGEKACGGRVQATPLVFGG